MQAFAARAFMPRSGLSAVSPFPFPSVAVVLFMGEHGADIAFVPVVVDRGDQPVFVASDVEHRTQASSKSVRALCA